MNIWSKEQERRIYEIEQALDRGQSLNDDDKLVYRDYLLVEWDRSKQELDAAKNREMELRKAVVAFAFDPQQKSGTERIELASGYEAKAVKKLNYGFVKTNDGKLDKAAIDRALSRIEERSGAGVYIAANLIKWDPTLSLTEYKKLSNEDKAIIDEVIVTSDGAPSLEIIPPKGKQA